MTVTQARKPAQQLVKADREQLKQRTRDVLNREISFICNPAFREMDEQRFWKGLLSKSQIRTTPTARPRGKFQMKAHLERLCDAPLLTAEEERILFRDMNYLKFRANALRATLHEKRPSLRKLEQIDAALSRAEEIRNEIIRANTRLIFSIVKKFTDDAIAFEEMLSDGISSLMNAVDKFNYDRGFRFSTYATMVVRRALYRSMERNNKIRARFVTGQSEVIDDEKEEHVVDEYSVTRVREINDQLAGLMSQLDEREQLIVAARYGFLDIGIKATFANLGKQLGVSKERVRQLELRAMDKLRGMIGEMGVFNELRGFAYRS